jgi:hypothetical protein
MSRLARLDGDACKECLAGEGFRRHTRRTPSIVPHE